MMYQVIKENNYYAIVEAATRRRVQGWFKLKRKADAWCREMNDSAMRNKNRFG